MTLKTIVNDALDEIGLPQTSSVIGDSDLTVVTLLRFANKEGRELSKAKKWQAITLEKTFSATAASVQTGAIPDDFGRFINDSMYNRTTNRKVLGPITPQQWQSEQANSTAAGPSGFFRQRGDDILITPDPTLNDTIAYEFMSTFWVDTDQDGLGEAVAWAADDDTSLLPEDLMTLGCIWRFKKSKGLPWENDFAEYNIQVANAGGQQGGAPSLSLTGGTGLLGEPNIPSQGFG